MSRLLEIVPAVVELQIPHVREVDSPFKRANHRGKVVLRVRAVASGAERDSVVRIVHHLHHALDVRQARDYAGKPEDTP